MGAWVKSRPVARSESTPLAGRRDELHLLRSQVQRARDGKGGVALVTGESGIGKTRLLDEIAYLAADAGAVVMRGGASEADGMPPYLPFLEALGAYIRDLLPTANVALQLDRQRLPFVLDLDGRFHVAPAEANFVRFDTYHGLARMTVLRPLS